MSTDQRFEIIFKTKSREELAGKTDYLIQFETKTGPAIYYGCGVLRYSGGALAITPRLDRLHMALSNVTYDWLEYALEPPAPKKFPRRIRSHTSRGDLRPPSHDPENRLASQRQPVER